MSVRVWNTLTPRKEALEPLEHHVVVEDAGASSRWCRQDGAEVLA